MSFLERFRRNPHPETTHRMPAYEEADPETVEIALGRVISALETDFQGYKFDIFDDPQSVPDSTKSTMHFTVLRNENQLFFLYTPSSLWINYPEEFACFICEYSPQTIDFRRELPAITEAYLANNEFLVREHNGIEFVNPKKYLEVLTRATYDSQTTRRLFEQENELIVKNAENFKKITLIERA